MVEYKFDSAKEKVSWPRDFLLCYFSSLPEGGAATLGPSFCTFQVLAADWWSTIKWPPQELFLSSVPSSQLYLASGFCGDLAVLLMTAA